MLHGSRLTFRSGLTVIGTAKSIKKTDIPTVWFWPSMVTISSEILKFFLRDVLSDWETML